MKKNVVIINYNTSELTECCIRSINRHVDDCIIYVFDNSDKEPFINTFDNVTVNFQTKAEDGTINTYTISVIRSDGNDLNKLYSASNYQEIYDFLKPIAILRKIVYNGKRKNERRCF